MWTETGILSISCMLMYTSEFDRQLGPYPQSSWQLPCATAEGQCSEYCCDYILSNRVERFINMSRCGIRKKDFGTWYFCILQLKKALFGPKCFASLNKYAQKSFTRSYPLQPTVCFILLAEMRSPGLVSRSPSKVVWLHETSPGFVH